MSERVVRRLRGGDAAPRPDIRAWRRRAVVGVYGGYVLLGGWLVSGGLGAVIVVIAVTIVLGGVWVSALARLFSAAHARANDPDEGLDERQRAVRDQAYLGAYRIVATTFLLGSVWLALAVDGRDGWLPGVELALAFAGGVIVLTLTLPTAFVAWNEPDDVEDE